MYMYVCVTLHVCSYIITVVFVNTFHGRASTTACSKRRFGLLDHAVFKPTIRVTAAGPDRPAAQRIAAAGGCNQPATPDSSDPQEDL